ncbi:hypothetical protein PPROV_000108500 [Pycnococcus provasolii]|uniref:Uncharacterized protein n=1 Tax=Pycnococcus provasolii TaxID=41880 RepID=A0A830H6R9_9CHLO|nr:hypothetical protein PPROV_000108500 [Pycnococcus provasolii]
MSSIPGCRHPCDPFGFALCAAPLPGNGWAKHHDDIKHAIVALAKDAGLSVQQEVTTLFLAGLSASTARRLPEDFFSAQRGYVPDILIRLMDTSARPPRHVDRLFDVKTLHVRQNPEYSGAYTNNINVEQRALAVHTLIERQIRQADHDYLGTPTCPSSGALMDGPLTQRLNSFGRVSGLVFGAAGEVSSDVGRLVDAISMAAVTTHAQRKGRVHAPQALAETIACNREHIAMAHLRGSAELLLNRIEHLTLPSSQRNEHRDHRYNYSSSWHSAFDHLHQAHSHAERTRAARGSFFTRTF